MNEQDLRHDYWSEIFDTMNDGLAVIAPDGTILMVHKALEVMTGYANEELVGHSCSIFNCDACDNARSTGTGKWCALFDGSRLTHKRCLLMHKDGGYFPALKNASILKDGSGEVLGAVEKKVAA